MRFRRFRPLVDRAPSPPRWTGATRTRARSCRHFAGRFGAADDATLVIHGGAEADVAPVAAALGDESPDMVLVAADGARPLAAAPRRGALGPAPHGELADLPWVARADLRSLYDLRLAGRYPRLHRFTCNLCGSAAVAENRGWPRDTATCPGCGSAARFRVPGRPRRARALRSQPRRSPALPRRPDLVGVGMSDHPALAARSAAG